MAGGHIDGREINAVTINADTGVIIYSHDGGYDICVPPPKFTVTLLGNDTFIAPDYCDKATPVQCVVFTVPASEGCVS